MKRTFTRQELYDLVWSTPISTLATQFDLSDRGLAKTCERHQIPVPGRGYWAKLDARQIATKTPLRKMYTPELETVHIGGVKVAANPYVAFAIEAATNVVQKRKIERQARSIEVSSSIPRHPEKLTPNEPTRFDPVKRPHPALDDFVTGLKSSKGDQDGEVNFGGVRLHLESRTRVISILHHLVLALENRGVTVTYDEKGIKAGIGAGIKFQRLASMRPGSKIG
jgi:hypothetical protein